MRIKLSFESLVDPTFCNNKQYLFVGNCHCPCRLDCYLLQAIITINKQNLFNYEMHSNKLFEETYFQNCWFFIYWLTGLHWYWQNFTPHKCFSLLHSHETLSEVIIWLNCVNYNYEKWSALVKTKTKYFLSIAFMLHFGQR